MAFWRNIESIVVHICTYPLLFFVFINNSLLLNEARDIFLFLSWSMSNHNKEIGLVSQNDIYWGGGVSSKLMPIIDAHKARCKHLAAVAFYILFPSCCFENWQESNLRNSLKCSLKFPYAVLSLSIYLTLYTY